MLERVVEVKETDNLNEVNFLLKEGWHLLAVGAHAKGFSYLLGFQKPFVK